ncbi:MAG: lysophospholipid acyltransferase family protein [Deltaproteobacteria bacterium]
MLRSIKIYLMSTVVAGFYWLLSRSWRMKEMGLPLGPKTRNPKLYAHWHGDELLLVAVSIHKNMAIMASRSSDGELMKRVLNFLGYKVVRGSSSRGGAGGLKGLIDLMKTGKYHSSLAVDGPRGPIYEVKPGILKLAQETGLPIIPAAAWASKKFVFKKSWNQCYLPLPFSKCIVWYGEPMLVPKNIPDLEFENLRKTLELRMRALKKEVEAHFEVVQKKPTFKASELLTHGV